MKIMDKVNRKLRRVWQRTCSAVWAIKMRGYFALLRLLKRFPPPQETDAAAAAKVIYLTFDDGPRQYTERLLAVLERYHVKATFFVTYRADHMELLAKIAAADHVIGNHTANHKYQELYASETSFLNALDKMEEIILRETGKRPSLLRFPGGSMSIDHFSSQPGMGKRLTELAQQRGYRCVDWDLDSRDTADALTAGTVYRNVVAGVRSRAKTIVLQHDIKRYSVAAVEAILVWGLRNGYTFLPLDADRL